jgi:hypothetical protein
VEWEAVDYMESDELLYRVAPEDQASSYEVLGKRYHGVELYRTDRPFMPMFAEVSPRFARCSMRARKNGRSPAATRFS